VLKQALQALQATDERVVELLRVRHRLASRLAQLSGDQKVPTRLEERVAAVVSQLGQRHPGPLDIQRLSALFEIVIQLTEPLSTGLPTRNGAPKKG